MVVVWFDVLFEVFKSALVLLLVVALLSVVELVLLSEVTVQTAAC